ncbi:MAG: hypothetical protein KJ906_03760 [Nanoarchaeota archaeon]|nr:hypothetical protein [Nanoarchaeota archaeon]
MEELTIELIQKSALEYYCKLRASEKIDGKDICLLTKGEMVCPIQQNIISIFAYTDNNEDIRNARYDCDFNNENCKGVYIEKVYNLLPNKIKEKFEPLIQAAKPFHTMRLE